MSTVDRRRQREFEQSPAPAEYRTVSYRCYERGVVLTRGAGIQAGRRASAAYRQRFGRKPQRAPELVQYRDLGTGELVAETYVFAYGQDAFDILDEAIDFALTHYGGEVRKHGSQ